MAKMHNSVARHIIAITSEVFGIDGQGKTFNQLGQMSKFIKELDKEFFIDYDITREENF